jgi:hypothetical protein
MIARLRRRHRAMIVVLFAITAALFVVALASRRSTPALPGSAASTPTR